MADDLMAYGTGTTDAAAMKDHERKLEQLLQRCLDVGIRLNADNMKLRQKSLTFLGHLITDQGLKPDPTRVAAVKQHLHKSRLSSAAAN